MEPLFIFYHLQAPQYVRNIIISVDMIQEMNYILINHKEVVHVLLMTKMSWVGIKRELAKYRHMTVSKITKNPYKDVRVGKKKFYAL